MSSEDAYDARVDVLREEYIFDLLKLEARRDRLQGYSFSQVVRDAYQREYEWSRDELYRAFLESCAQIAQELGL